MKAVSPTLAHPAAQAGSRLADYLELTKPEVTLLVLVSTLVGFCTASRPETNLWLLLQTLLGTALVAAGTATLNQYLEREADAKMRRTANRPLPAGRLHPQEALLFGIGLSLAGVLYLALTVNRLSSLLAALTLTSYLLLYTPLKTRSPLCTFVGAFPGAMPPLIGWAAARGTLDPEAWILYAMLFLWQFPHFLAIAWMYREDYARAGVRMLPVVDNAGPATGRQVILTSLLLLPVSLLPTWLGMAGRTYFAGALLLGLGFIAAGIALAVLRANAQAKRLLQVSILYLPLVFLLLLLDAPRP